jgi:hypothetical protein
MINKMHLKNAKIKIINKKLNKSLISCSIEQTKNILNHTKLETQNTYM